MQGTIRSLRAVLSRPLAAAAVALLAVGVTACGSSSSSSSPAASGGGSTGSASGTGHGTSLTTELPQLYSTAPLTVAINDGTFAKSGLAVKTEPYDPATAVPLVLQGQAQIGFAGLGAVLQAISKGIPLTIIAGTATNTSSLNLGGIVVKKNSGITSLKDLTGKTVALNALKNDAQATLQNYIDAAGGDSTKTKFVPVPFPGMPAALAGGQVDAVSAVAPFLQALVAAGNVNLGPFYPPHFPNGVFFVSNAYLAKNRATVDAFRTALGAEYGRLNKDRAPASAVMVNTYHLPAKAAATIPPVPWSVSILPTSLQSEVAIMQKYHILTSTVNINTAVLK